MWRRIRYRELCVKWGRLERSKQLSHCSVPIYHDDKRCTMSSVWSRNGVNLLRRDDHYALVRGKWKLRTTMYFATISDSFRHVRGARHAACGNCDARCCRDKYTTVVLTSEEVGAVLRGEVNWPIERSQGHATLAKNENGECAFLTKDGRCGIYKKRRPIGCRVWFCGRGTDDDKIYRAISSNMGIAA